MAYLNALTIDRWMTWHWSKNKIQYAKIFLIYNIITTCSMVAERRSIRQSSKSGFSKSYWWIRAGVLAIYKITSWFLGIDSYQSQVIPDCFEQIVQIQIQFTAIEEKNAKKRRHTQKKLTSLRQNGPDAQDDQPLPKTRNRLYCNTIKDTGTLPLTHQQ